MFKKLNSRSRLRLLAAGIGMLLVLVYVLALQETIGVIGACGEKEERLARSKQLEQEIAGLKLQVRNIDMRVGSQADTTRKVMDLLLEHISDYCNSQGCVLKEIPATAKAMSNGYEVETYFITLSGNFRQLLDLVYVLEQKKKTGGHITSLLFYSVKNNRTKKPDLHLTIHVQRYKKT